MFFFCMHSACATSAVYFEFETHSNGQGKLDLVNLNANIKFGEILSIFLKILSGKEMMTDEQMNKQTDGMTDNPNPI